MLVRLDSGGQLARLPSAGAEALAGKRYLLLQFGGGRGFAGAMRELHEAVGNARAGSDSFAHVLVPRPGGTVEAAVQVVRESGFTGPVVDPREHALVAQLWTQYGHSGPFALALVDAQGQIVSQTIPTARGVDKFHTVLGSLSEIASGASSGTTRNRPADNDGAEPATPSRPTDTVYQAFPPGEAVPAAPATVYAAARAAFHKKEFAELNVLAEQVTRERSLSRTARAELEDLFAAVEAEAPKRPDVWPAYLDSIDQWIAADPRSPTAYVAKANAWTDYAWLARGHGYGDTVTAEGWQLFHERIARARTVLETSRTLGATGCPHWYAAMLTVARAQNWKLEDTLALAQEGIAAAPWYHPTYHAMITHLLPRWHGQPGDWQTFARRAAEQAGPREGPFLYACLTGRAQASGEELFLTLFPVDWALLRTGYEELVQRYPDPQLWRQFCQLACLGGDRQKARETFAHASFSISFRPWHNEGEVAAWKAWAEGGAVPAQRAQQEQVFELWKDARKERERRPNPNAT